MSNHRSVPSYRKHRQSGQAIVTLPDGYGGRRDILLGKHGSSESKVEYARQIAEWEANERRLPIMASQQGLTVNELMLAYWTYAESYYRKNGEPTSQLDRIRYALKPVKRLYGHTDAKSFGPLALKAVREEMVKQGWARGYTNSCVGCIKRMFKFGVENELVPLGLYHGLLALEGLKAGRSAAKESLRIRPVPDSDVLATLPKLTRAVRAMVQVQRLSGMRPIETVLMRPCDIDRSAGRTWLYRPMSHKTEHHGAERAIFLGPQAQTILRPFLFREPDAYLFSPREMVEAFRKIQRKERKTPVQPSQVDRRKRRAKKRPGERYSVGSYRRAIQTACAKLGIARWHPNQLRHTLATEIRKEAGLDTSKAVLGHKGAEVTQVYAELDQRKAADIMERIG